jgi:hypothetical protein
MDLDLLFALPMIILAIILWIVMFILVGKVGYWLLLWAWNL